MKKFRIVEAKESIASFMIGFDTYKMSYTDFYNWSKYLEKKLTNKKYKTIVLYGKNYLDELKRDDNGFLFNINNSFISLAEYKSEHHLNEHIFSYISVDLLLDLLEAPKGFKMPKENIL